MTTMTNDDCMSWCCCLFIPSYDIGDTMTGVTCGAGKAYFSSGFYKGPCCFAIGVFLFHVIVFLFFEFGCSFCLIAWYLYIIYILH